MNRSSDRLYKLLPAVYRLRDAEQGESLCALLAIISEQVNLVEADIAQMYDNWFIETCDEWIVPYSPTCSVIKFFTTPASRLMS